MKYLLDTHAFLWFNRGDSQLSAKARDLIENTQNEMLVSMAVSGKLPSKTHWEKWNWTAALRRSWIM